MVTFRGRPGLRFTGSGSLLLVDVKVESFKSKEKECEYEDPIRFMR